MKVNNTVPRTLLSFFHLAKSVSERSVLRIATNLEGQLGGRQTQSFLDGSWCKVEVAGCRGSKDLRSVNKLKATVIIAKEEVIL